MFSVGCTHADVITRAVLCRPYLCGVPVARVAGKWHAGDRNPKQFVPHVVSHMAYIDPGMQKFVDEWLYHNVLEKFVKEQPISST